MPTYSYECPKCENRETVLLTLAEHDNYAPRHCGKRMFQVMFAPQITTDIQPYRSMITGERIAGRAQHREHLRQHGCIEVGNETPKARKTVTTGNRKETLHKMLGDVSEKQLQGMVQKEISSRHGR